MYSSTVFLTLALERSEWSASHSKCFTPRELAHGTHLIGGWMGPRAKGTKQHFNLLQIFLLQLKNNDTV